MADSYDGRMIAIESLWPTRRHWLLGSPYARKTASPFLELKDFPEWEEVVPLLQENGEVEIKFDTIGRELKILGAWDGFRAYWFDALRAALERRER